MNWSERVYCGEHGAEDTVRLWKHWCPFRVGDNAHMRKGGPQEKQKVFLFTDGQVLG